MPSCICWNCDEDFANVPDGDKYGTTCLVCKEWFCSQTCLSEHENSMQVGNEFMKNKYPWGTVHSNKDD
jgi:hypothetical protein